MKQRTILREVSLSGNALHTGEPVTLTMKPAPAGHGIVFKRIDLAGQPEVKPRVDLIIDLVRATTIQSGHAKISTVEHVLSALNGCGIDNVLVEMNASEPPIMDGSAKPFVNLILEAEPVEQEAEREYFVLDQPVSVTRGNSSIIALPCRRAEDLLHLGRRPRHPHAAPLAHDRPRHLHHADRRRPHLHDLRGHRGAHQAGQDQGRQPRLRHRHQGRQDHLEGAAALQGRVRPPQDPRHHRRPGAARRAAEGAHHRHAAGPRDQRRADQGALRAAMEELKNGAEEEAGRAPEAGAGHRDLARHPPPPRHAARTAIPSS